MAAWLFTKAILADQPIQLFNRGRMQRDFTYIDDVVAGVLACLAKPPADTGDAPPCRIYNLGNHSSEPLERFIGILERAIGKTARRELLDPQPGQRLLRPARRRRDGVGQPAGLRRDVRPRRPGLAQQRQRLLRSADHPRLCPGPDLTESSRRGG